MFEKDVSRSCGKVRQDIPVNFHHLKRESLNKMKMMLLCYTLCYYIQQCQIRILRSAFIEHKCDEGNAIENFSKEGKEA